MWNTIVEWVLGYLGRIITFIFQDKELKENFNKALDLAIPIVVDLIDSDSDGDEKRNIAFDTLKEELKEASITLRDHLIYLAIEMAVASAKK